MTSALAEPEDITGQRRQWLRRRQTVWLAAVGRGLLEPTFRLKDMRPHRLTRINKPKITNYSCRN